MSEIFPFKGVVYNSKKIKDFSKVVCPPYDIISPQEQDSLYKLSSYNFIKLDLNKGTLDLNSPDNRYASSAKLFKEWLDNKILVEDKQPAIYLNEQQFTVNGEKFTRLGVFAALKLEDENACIFPHEYTHSKPKIDRLNLITQTKANFSPIFCLFSDKGKFIQKIAKLCKKKAPLFSFTDKDGVKQKFWRVEEKSVVSSVNKYFKNKAMFIADGHHRFEVACQYRILRKSQDSKPQHDASYNYVMIYLTDAESKDNLILPYHRVLVRKDIDKAKILECAKNYFEIEKAKNRDELSKFLKKNSKISGVFGLYFPQEVYKLKLKDDSVFEGDLFLDYSKTTRKLDVVVLQNLILSKLNLSEGDLTYTPDEKIAHKSVENLQANCAFILNPVRIEQLKQVVSSGMRMPQKSTYFYPKVSSGLVINKL